MQRLSFTFAIHFYTPLCTHTIPQLFPAWLCLIFHIHEDNLAKLDWKVHRRESYPCSARDLIHHILQSPQIQRVHSQLAESAPEKSISAMLQYTGDKLISSQAISTQVEMRVGFITEGVFYCAFSRLAPYVVNMFYPLIYVASLTTQRLAANLSFLKNFSIC